jgi:hypothetical protein
MRRWEIIIVMILLNILILSHSAFALEEKNIDGKIIHDSSHPKITSMFIEDVVSLLPLEMAQILEPNLETMLKEAEFNVRDDYWKRKVIGKNNFKVRLESISIKDGTELASQLGGSVKHIFEIALHPNNSNISGEGLRKNLRDVPNSWKNGIFEVKYQGYQGQSVDVILTSLYEMKKRNKTSLYPDLVVTTAELWSSIWQKGGGRVQIVTKTFVRKPMALNFRKNAGPSTPPPRR